MTDLTFLKLYNLYLALTLLVSHLIKWLFCRSLAIIVLEIQPPWYIFVWREISVGNKLNTRRRRTTLLKIHHFPLSLMNIILVNEKALDLLILLINLQLHIYLIKLSNQHTILIIHFPHLFLIPERQLAIILK